MARKLNHQPALMRLPDLERTPVREVAVEIRKALEAEGLPFVWVSGEQAKQAGVLDSPWKAAIERYRWVAVFSTAHPDGGRTVHVVGMDGYDFLGKVFKGGALLMVKLAEDSHEHAASVVRVLTTLLGA